MQTYVVTDIPDPMELQSLYQTHWWFDGRTVEDIRQSVKESDEVFGVRTRADDALVASCRVLTDYTYTGKILDVIVDESVRGQGVGSTLLDAVTDHPRLVPVDELTLTCRAGLAPFYEQCGFKVHDMMQESDESTGEDYYVMVST